MAATILGSLQKCADDCPHAVHGRLLRWTKSATRTPVHGAMAHIAMSKAAGVAENALPRRQLIVLQRQVTQPSFTPRDRVALALLARLAHGWRTALLIIQPDTLPRWHRHGSRLVWRVRSATALKRPQVSAATVALIKRMAEKNRLWGAERIRGELLKLGIRVGKRTVQRHLRGVGPTRPRGQTWATFLHNHADDVWACDVLPIIDLGFRSPTPCAPTAAASWTSSPRGRARISYTPPGGRRRAGCARWRTRVRSRCQRQ